MYAAKAKHCVRYIARRLEYTYGLMHDEYGCKKRQYIPIFVSVGLGLVSSFCLVNYGVSSENDCLCDGDNHIGNDDDGSDMTRELLLSQDVLTSEYYNRDTINLLRRNIDTIITKNENCAYAAASSLSDETIGRYIIAAKGNQEEAMKKIESSAIWCSSHLPICISDCYQDMKRC